MKGIIRNNLLFLLLFVIVIAFTLSVIQDNPLAYLKNFFTNQYFLSSSIVYCILIIISTIFSPITIIPAIPFIAKIFGPVHTFSLTLFGIFIGSTFSFLVARHFGRKTVLKFFNKKSLEKLEKTIPRNLRFLDVLFFRFFTIPEGLSYFLGLYSKINFIKYFIVTIIGLLPITFILTFGPEAIGSGNKILFFSLLLAVFIIIFSYLSYKFLLLKKIKLVTHSGDFHVDDVFAAATLVLFLEKRGIQYEIIRTRDYKILEKYKKQARSKKDEVFVFDVGEEYNEKYNLFDHHQLNGPIRENGINYSSFGLIWKKYGEKVCGSKKIAKMIDKKICLPIDAEDNGIYVSKNILDIAPYHFSLFMRSFYPMSDNIKDFDKSFLEIMDIFKNILKREINIFKKKIEDEKIFCKIYNKTENKKMIIIEDKSLVLPEDFLKYPELLFIVQKSLENNYKINTVVESNSDFFKRRKLFPDSWAGKRGKELDAIIGVKGANFCHRKKFVAGAYKLKTAIKMTKIVLEE